MRHDAECACGSGGPSRAATGVGLALCVILSFFLVCNLTVIVKGALFPDRPLYLFDTFEGFDARDVEKEKAQGNPPGLRLSKSELPKRKIRRWR